MSTELATAAKEVKSEEPTAATLKPFVYTITKAIVLAKIEKYKSLIVIPEGDREEFEIVKKARLDLKHARCKAKNEHDDFKAPIIEMGKSIDSYYNAIKNLIEPEETRLEKLENEFESAEREAEKRRLDVREQSRRLRLDAVGGAHTADNYREWSDESFSKYLTECVAFNQKKREQEAEAERVAEENRQLAEKNRLESERLAALQRELDAKAAQLKAKETVIPDPAMEAGREAHNQVLSASVPYLPTGVSIEGSIAAGLPNSERMLDAACPTAQVRPSGGSNGGGSKLWLPTPVVETTTVAADNESMLAEYLEQLKNLKKPTFIGSRASAHQTFFDNKIDGFIKSLESFQELLSVE